MRTFLLAVLAFPGETHEGDGRQALQSGYPLLINGLLACVAFATAGFLAATLRRRGVAAPEDEDEDLAPVRHGLERRGRYVRRTSAGR